MWLSVGYWSCCRSLWLSGLAAGLQVVLSHAPDAFTKPLQSDEDFINRAQEVDGFLWLFCHGRALLWPRFSLSVIVMHVL